MAWTSPMTAVANSAFTAAQFNTHVRDNLLETAVAKATTSGTYFVGTGVNAIAERTAKSDSIDPGTAQTTTSTSYTNLTTPGPTVTVTTGTKALVLISCYVFNTNSGEACYVSVAVSGATTIDADDVWCLQYESNSSQDVLNATRARMFDLTAGSNTFTMKYRVSGPSGTGTFRRRELTVIPY